MVAVVVVVEVLIVVVVASLGAAIKLTSWRSQLKRLLQLRRTAPTAPNIADNRIKFAKFT